MLTEWWMNHSCCEDDSSNQNHFASTTVCCRFQLQIKNKRKKVLLINVTSTKYLQERYLQFTLRQSWYKVECWLECMELLDPVKRVLFIKNSSLNCFLNPDNNAATAQTVCMSRQWCQVNVGTSNIRLLVWSRPAAAVNPFKELSAIAVRFTKWILNPKLAWYSRQSCFVPQAAELMHWYPIIQSCYWGWLVWNPRKPVHSRSELSRLKTSQVDGKKKKVERGKKDI